MAKIAIIGAGRVGNACLSILKHVGIHAEVVLIDIDQHRLKTVNYEPSFCVEDAQLEETIEAQLPDLIMCCTPFYINTRVAKVASKLGCHYLDFTEDNAVTETIEGLTLYPRQIFVPQTGLAPGLINYIGLALFKRIGKPQSLDLRVGALPQVSTGPEHYAVTWSEDGLINEYLNTCLRKKDGVEEGVESLDELEDLIINGVKYEAFTTSGGLGNPDSYYAVPNVEYKTVRYPGHLRFMRKFFEETGYALDKSIAKAKTTFKKTRDDLVVLAATATDEHGMSASAAFTFYPDKQLGLTALELTTAGIGCAVAELILTGFLPGGVLRQDQIPLEKVNVTKSYHYVMSFARETPK